MKVDIIAELELELIEISYAGGFERARVTAYFNLYKGRAREKVTIWINLDQDPRMKDIRQLLEDIFKQDVERWGRDKETPCKK